MSDLLRLSWATVGRTLVAYIVLLAITVQADAVAVSLIAGLVLLGWVLLPATDEVGA